MTGGTDVNFGSLSRQLLDWLGRQDGCSVKTSHRVTDLKRRPNGGGNDTTSTSIS